MVCINVPHLSIDEATNVVSHAPDIGSYKMRYSQYDLSQGITKMRRTNQTIIKRRNFLLE